MITKCTRSWDFKKRRKKETQTGHETLDSKSMVPYRKIRLIISEIQLKCVRECKSSYNHVSFTT